jgi:hypothetical protein
VCPIRLGGLASLVLEGTESNFYDDRASITT